MKNQLKLKTVNKPLDSIVSTMMDKAQWVAKHSLDYECKSFAHHNFKLTSPSTATFKFGREQEGFEILPFATSQLCNKIGMPYLYFKKLEGMRANQLLLDNVNFLTSLHSGNILLRTTDNKIRGVLTPKYQPFDTDDLLDVFANAFPKTGPMAGLPVSVRGYYQSLDYFHLRFSSEETIKGLDDKDLTMGMQLTSSDVGRSSIRLRFFIYKQICTNGLCLPIFDKSLYEQRHIAVSKDAVYRGLSEAFNQFPYLIAKATEILAHGSQASLVGNGLIVEPATELARNQRGAMKKFLGVGDEDMNALADLTMRNYTPTLWGYVNAITEHAQKYEISRRMELEAKAGELLTVRNLNNLAA